MAVTQTELNILRAAKMANPWWFKALIFCAKIMLPRRAKYSGVKHPYHNFFDVAKKQGDSVFNVFQFYNNVKLSRKEASTSDFGDEGFKDTLADLANYALLFLGYLLGEITQDDVDNYTEPDWNEHPYEWPTILVDFDGVLNMYGDPAYGGWKGYFEHYPVRPGAYQFLSELKEAGACIVIHTVRPDMEETWQWLEDNNLKQFITDITNIKPAGVVLLDDRALKFTGDFNKAREEIRVFRTHWE